ncbi:hypothetical protein [Acinetobacter variabilis]|uniref:hypothetical protein n=1 Tax=Acinetobacter variabilis TaxID=70346 RepID=UPI0026710F75|nr:hypothetical protein [Acinetobacter variabilis]WKT71778.1 hypothetical protein Q3F87_00030 [Acinetobacter variabilis]
MQVAVRLKKCSSKDKLVEDNNIYLSETEVYQLADSVINSICNDLNETVYKELGGKLSIVWGVQEKFNASATILNRASDPPNHRITLNYFLVKELYKDTISYHEFAENIHYQPSILAMLNSISEMPMLPEVFIKKDSINNMFMASLTFIFFHELGHLMQQHGRIRATFSGQSIDDSIINECNAIDSIPLTGKQAAISHTTELAADSSAITKCIFEIMRQFSSKELIGNDDKGVLFLATVQLFVSGVSSLFYRFRGINSENLEAIPSGTHPQPLTRLEINLPHIYEMLSFPIIEKIMEHKLDRKGIVELVSRAAYSVAFFWIVRSENRPEGLPENYLFKGILQSQELKKYVECIITTWDEIEPMIDSLNLDELPFTKLSFTEELRSVVKL